MHQPTTVPARPRRARWLAPTLAVLAALVAGLLGGAVLGQSAATAEHTTYEPAPDTIVKVVGDAANGFGIHYYDGSAAFPPTDSEAIAECTEYDTARARVRCRSAVRTWYRDLADMKQTIAYYRWR